MLKNNSPQKSARTAKKFFTAKSIAVTAICIALNVVCSWITVPFFSIPFTLQTFSIFFTLYFLGAKKGTVAIFIYILLGLIGIPVFSGFKSGVPALAGATGGYIIGFLLSGVSYFIFDGKNKFLRIVGLFVGLLLCYVGGTLWFVFVYGKSGKEIGFFTALTLCVFPFVVFDVLKIILSILLSDVLKKRLHFPAS